MKKFLRIGPFLISVLIFFACYPPGPKVEGPSALVLVPERKVPFVVDDMHKDSLRAAVMRSIDYFGRLPQEREFVFGPHRFSARYLIESLYVFLDLTEKLDKVDIFNKRLKEYFDFYQSVGEDGEGTILYTGYYEPVLDGSLTKTEKYKYALYRRPDDLIQINLGLFHPKFSGEKIMARYRQGQIIPYLNREEIDYQHALAHKGYEIVWLSDPIDRFFLHIQGSGCIRLEQGGFIKVHYAASNGRPYRSIGRLLIDEGIVPQEEASLPLITRYLRNHSQEIERIFSHNESYVFFEVVDKGPLGSIGVLLTPGRSIATDPVLFPRGAVAAIFTEKPIIEGSEVVDWHRFSRLVMNQDTGGVIKGPGRVDIFWGSGSKAELVAGHMKEEGKLYFLVKKRYKHYGIIRG